jgi:2-polyprenyl-6-methoxyphenol hydroxylase-like FAD-dependent oxidoreductase
MSDPVLIVGAGPTGLTAALELCRFGLPVRIVDKLAEPLGTSRAIGVQARTLELRGLSEEIVRLGNPGLAGSVYGGGTRVFRLDFTQIDSAMTTCCLFRRQRRSVFCARRSPSRAR